MEIINQHRRYKDGLEFGFPQTIKRDNHGRFTNQIFSKRNEPSLALGCLMVLVIISVTMTITILSAISR